jgi:UDP-glucose 4-epimerase
VAEVIDAARRVTGHEIPAEEAPRRAGRPGRARRLAERARRLLGWEPQRDDLDRIVADAWAERS